MLRATGFERRGLGRRAAPFLALLLLGFAVVPLPPYGPHPAPVVAAAAVLCLAIVGFVVLIPWRRVPRWMQSVPLLGTLAVVALLRHGEGGAGSVLGPVALTPVFWASLYGRRRELATAIVGLGAIFVVPHVLIGGRHYPMSEWERSIIWTSSGLVIGVTVQSLVARIQNQSRQLSALASSDALTGLANRRVWDEALDRELARAQRTGEPLALCLIDLNGFKAYNDTHGHPAADQLLKTVAARWSGTVRAVDTLARLGGDEFGVLLPGLDLAAASGVVERLHGCMPDGETFAAGIVVGDGSAPPETIVRHADARMYEAKATGRPTVAA